MTAERIELYLKPSGDELERAEAYAGDSDKVTIREQNRKTSGAHLTYTICRRPVCRHRQAGDDRRRSATSETIGRTLTFVKATDTIVVDGNGSIRTQTKGTGAACK